MNYAIEFNNELYHHGIKGQKWGERNAEWYPIDAYEAAKDRGSVGSRAARIRLRSDRLATKASKLAIKSTSSFKTKYQREKLDAKSKKLRLKSDKLATKASKLDLKASRLQDKLNGKMTNEEIAKTDAFLYGAANKPASEYDESKDHSTGELWVVSHAMMAVQIALAATTGYISPSAFLSNVATNVASDVKLAKDIVEKSKVRSAEKRRASEETDPKTGLKLKPEPTSIEDDAKRVNVRTVSAARNNNCVLASVAYDLRRRGFDVEAGPSLDGFSRDEIASMYKNLHYQRPDGSKLKPESQRSTQEVIEQRNTAMSRAQVNELKSSILKQGDGARGLLSIGWYQTFSGHCISYEVRNGQVKIVDAQQHKVWDIDDCPYWDSASSDIAFARSDTATPNYETLKTKGYIKG